MILLHRQSGSIDTDLEQEVDGKHRKKILYSSTICLLVGTEEKLTNKSSNYTLPVAQYVPLRIQSRFISKESET